MQDSMSGVCFVPILIYNLISPKSTREFRYLRLTYHGIPTRIFTTSSGRMETSSISSVSNPSGALFLIISGIARLESSVVILFLFESM